tara:strand:- start:27 stop:440 length:414 start_codon:yes stop_codon:yes gene_type:complete
MNLLFIIILAVPIIEIFLMIEIGVHIGALNTVLLIIFTAVTGIYYAKLEGLNTLRSGFSQLVKNEIPAYELMSGAAIAIGAVLLIFPGFLTDFIGFTLIIPLTRKIIFKLISPKFQRKKNDPDFIEGESEEIDDNKK